LSEQKLQQSQRYASAALALLERNAVPPFPDFYRLFYDYLAGLQQVTSWRVEAVLHDGGREPVRERLYKEFVQPYERGEAVDSAGSLVTERIEVLTALIDDAMDSNRAHSASLEAAATSLAANSTRAALLKDWIKRLETANRIAIETNKRLVKDMDATAAAFQGVCEELARHRRDSQIDPLTGVANRLGFDASLALAMADARENGRQFALAIIDIDHFKSLNDSYGHQAGDNVLRFVARSLLANSRGSDAVGRFGGDEFVAVVRDADERQADGAADRLCRSMREIDLQQCIGDDVLGNITCSVGITCFREGDTVSSMLGRADQCLYEAKHTGRNRWVSNTPAMASLEAQSA
jgi:diguanylate cyclase